MAAYRDKHQPNVLRLAARDLALVTAGQYTTITAADDGRSLSIGDAHMGFRTESDLSRGTMELLYILLRLALATDHADTTHPMPIVMDDILVNLDPTRAHAIAKLLTIAAQRHQIIMLTCRPETRDLLTSLDPRAHVIELKRYAGRKQPVTPQVQTRRTPAPALTDSTARSEAAEAIYQVLKEADEALRKNDILERASVDAGAWTGAINELKERGDVENLSRGKGSIYVLAGTENTVDERDSILVSVG